MKTKLKVVYICVTKMCLTLTALHGRKGWAWCGRATRRALRRGWTWQRRAGGSSARFCGKAPLDFIRAPRFILRYWRAIIIVFPSELIWINSWMFYLRSILSGILSFHPIIFCVDYIQWWVFVPYCNCLSIWNLAFERPSFAQRSSHEICIYFLKHGSQIGTFRVPQAARGLHSWLLKSGQERVFQNARTVLSRR